MARFKVYIGSRFIAIVDAPSPEKIRSNMSIQIMADEPTVPIIKLNDEPSLNRSF